MHPRTIARHILGYVLGASIFGISIPYGIFRVAALTPIPLPIPDASRVTAAAILGCIGIFFGIWSNIALFFDGGGGPTDGFNIPVSPRTQRLVVRGPYRYTRNPMVFGAFSVYLALAIFWNSLPTALAVTAFLAAVRYYLRKTEEKRLLKDFGTEYEEYRRTTSMILPWPRKMI